MDKYLGKRLDGRYQLKELIGVGGMAYVYKAEDLKTGETVAVKILRDELLQNAELVRRFKNESRAIGLLDHENIVKVLDVNYSDSTQFIVMEYLNGVTLKEYIDANKPVSWKNAVFITEQLLKALQHAHDRGIIHRDVKPQNVMLSSTGKVKVMDFGIARFSRSRVHTITDKAIGTVHYISPEQAKGEDTDVRSDIYSVGVMLYEMCTGQLPFDGDSAVSIALMQISDDAPTPRSINPSIPEGLEDIIVRAMEKEKDRRYQSAGAMLLDLEEFRKNPDVSFEYKYIPAVAAAPTVTEAVKEKTPVSMQTLVIPKKEDVPVRTVYKAADKEEAADKAPLADSKKTKEKKMARKNKASKVKKTATASPSEKKAKVVNLPIALLMGITAVVLIGAVVLAVMTLKSGGSQLFTQHADTNLPDFVGQMLRDVQADPSYSLYNFSVIEEYNSEYETGYIFSQTPFPPKIVKDNANITLYVSKGPKIVAVPDIIGHTYGDAMRMLQEQGLVVVRETDVSADYDPNTITKVDPPVGTSLESGSTVTIYVNSPNFVSTARVPDIIGMDFSAAKAMLATRGIRVGELIEVYDPTVPAGTVLEQSLEPGTQVVTGVYMDITISTPIGTFTHSFNIATPYSDASGKTSYSVKFVDVITGETIATTTGSAATGATLTLEGNTERLVRVEIEGRLYQIILLNFQTGTYTVEEDHTADNGFINSFSIHLSYDTSMGSVNCHSTVRPGESVTITITPNAGYHIVSVTDNGMDVTGMVSSGTLVISNVSSDHSIVVTFAAD